MSVLDKPFYQLAEIRARWNMGEHDLAAFVLAGELTLSTTVAGLRVIYGTIEEMDLNYWGKFPMGHRYIIGTLELERDDAWTVLREGGHVINRFKAADHEYLAVDDHRWINGLSVCRDDLVIGRAEIDRFEDAHPKLAAIADRRDGGNRGTDAGDSTEDQRGAARPGAPTKYDWDAFWVEVCRRIHDEGLPETQGKLIQLMLDWFDETGCRTPDASTVKKKVRPLWQKIAPGGVLDALPSAGRHRA
jgi:hypothetical protein